MSPLGSSGTWKDTLAKVHTRLDIVIIRLSSRSERHDLPQAPNCEGLNRPNLWFKFAMRRIQKGVRSMDYRSR